MEGFPGVEVACCTMFLPLEVVVPRRFREYDPEQPYLLPPDPRARLPEGHLAFFIHELVQQLDLSDIYADYAPDVGGRPPLEQRMLVSVWLYSYAVGIRSSRKVQMALVEDVAFRFLSGNLQPAYWALSRFRTRHKAALWLVREEREVSHASGPGEARACGYRWQQALGEREQEQGDELRAHAVVGGAP